ncbi:TIGR03668 family PPOX class F420-dependent oxidoreductase [Nonomuraea aurantiaca]|uniref:TIGR03668 family PPOX class F420-dependent oxidoreductase n=1 Tax=Nonomuraea aurantiaca TaxID=2878562 RepID=UPI001CDA2FFD|nr:TIGR03668 family PPOX class F420-dependent oxidoreductase [Nonomuraea aurantiaca]MCA2229568.1 TIGR03668 family PPOX class F420-dependent oxidoreductase [Nonomuraea aurantiaca]
MDEATARAKFLAARSARLATVDGQGAPHLVPVVFAVADDMIAFAVDDKPKRTTDLRRLRNIASNNQVCVLVDHYADDWRRLWWARADGTAALVEDDTTRGQWLDRLAARYDQYVERRPAGPVVAITVARWSGWAYDD